MATTVEQLNVKIEVDASGAVKSIKLAGQGVKDLAKNFKNAESETKSFSSSFSKLGSTIVVANQAIEIARRAYQALSGAMRLTVGSALDLGKSVAEITTLLDDSAGMTQKLTNDILDLQARYGGQQADIARAYYNAISSGAVDASTAVGLLDSAQKLAIGGVTSLENATTGLVSILNGFGLSADSATRVSDALFIGMKKGQTTVGALSAELGMVSDIARTAGLSLEEMVSAVSAMTTAGISTSIAVTQLRAAIVGLNKPSEELQAIYNKLNISNIETTISSKGFVETLKMIVKQTDGTNQALFQLFGRQEAVAGILKLTGDTIGPRYIATLKEMQKAALSQGAATEEAYNKIAKTTRQVFDVMKGQITSALTRIGDAILIALLPAIEKLADSFTDIAEIAKDLSLIITQIKFKELGEKVLYVVGTFVTLKAAMTALALMQGVRGVELLTVAFGSLAPNILKAAAAVSVFTKSFLAFAKIAAIVIAVATAVELLIDNLGRLDKLGNTIIQGLKLLFEKLKLTIKELSIALTDMIIDWIENLNPLLAKWTGFVLDIDRARESQAKLKKEVADATFSILDQEDAWKELSKGVDLSGIGFVMDETKKGAQETAYWLGKNWKLTDDIARNLKVEETNQNAITELVKKQLQALEAIREENRRYELDLLNYGATQEKQISNNLTYDKQSLEIKKRKLAVEKLLTGEMGRQMTEELKKQQQYIEKKAKLELEALSEQQAAREAEERAKSVTPEMQIAMAIGTAMGEGAGFITMALEDGWNYFAGMIDEAWTKLALIFKTGSNDLYNKMQSLELGNRDVMPAIDLGSLAQDFIQAGRNFGEALADGYNALTGDISTYIAAAQAVVDILPNTLDNLTKLFDSIAEWPDRILESVTKLMDSAVKVLTDFVPKFFKNLPKIFEKIFVQGIPKMIVALTEVLSNIDEIIVEGFIEKMPDLIEEATYRIISSLPIIIDRLVVFLVRKLPTIAARLTELILIDFPIRFAEGVLKALSDGWKYIIEGKKPDWFDNEIAQKSAKKFTSLVTAGTSEQLFRLLDEEAAKRRTRNANEIEEAIARGARRAVSYWDKWWSELEKGWNTIENKTKESIKKVSDDIKSDWDEFLESPTFMGKMEALGKLAGDAQLLILSGFNPLIYEAMDSAYKNVEKQWKEELQPHLMTSWNKIADDFKENLDLFFGSEGLQGHFEGMGNLIGMTFLAQASGFNPLIYTALEEGMEGAKKYLESEEFKNAANDVFEAASRSAMAVLTLGLSEIYTNEDVKKGMLKLAELFIGPINSFITSPDLETKLKSLGEILANEALIILTGGLILLPEKIKKKFEESFKNIDWNTLILNSLSFGLYSLAEKFGEKIKEGISNIDWLEILKTALLGPFQTIFNSLNPGNIFSKIFKIDPSETEKGEGGTVENILGINLPFVQFAEGGRVPGNASIPGDSEINDKILALLSPGEAIIPRSIMSDPVLSKIIEKILSGKFELPKFAKGGTFGKIASGDISGAFDDLKNISTSQAKKEIENAIQTSEAIVDMLNPEKMWKKVRDFVMNDLIWKLFENNKFHDGGIIQNRIPGFYNGTDDVLIKAQSGEFMLNRTGRAMIGDNVLNAANQGRSANGDYNQTINININTSKPFDESLVKTRIIPEIKKEIKRNSIDGRFLMDQRGLRA